MKKHQILLFIVTIVVITMIVGCARTNNASTIPDPSETSSNSSETTTIPSEIESSESSRDSVLRTIVDMKGNAIEITGDVNRYLVLWKSYTGVMAMLDKCEGLVGCDYNIESARDAWLFEICPEASDLTIVTEEITAEEVANLDVDVLFWQNANCEELANQCIKLGIPAVNINFEDYETMKQSILIAAEVLGTESAKDIASKFNAYLDQTILAIGEKAKEISDAERVNILNLRNVKDLRADGKGTVADTWIECIGAINIVGAHNLEGNQYLDIEQLYDWNPDIIVSSVSGDDKLMYDDPQFAPLSAVKNKKVYVNPNGIFYWNRYSVETPLQLYWAASTFYPERYPDIDIILEAQSFYLDFFNYEISNGNIERMLNGLEPQP